MICNACVRADVLQKCICAGEQVDIGFDLQCLRALQKCICAGEKKGREQALLDLRGRRGMRFAALQGLSMRRCPGKSVTSWHKGRGKLDFLQHIILQFLSSRADAFKGVTCWQKGNRPGSGCLSNGGFQSLHGMCVQGTREEHRLICDALICQGYGMYAQEKREEHKLICYACFSRLERI